MTEFIYCTLNTGLVEVGNMVPVGAMAIEDSTEKDWDTRKQAVLDQCHQNSDGQYIFIEVRAAKNVVWAEGILFRLRLRLLLDRIIKSENK